MITIGTRGSDLALWQANYTRDLLEKQGHEVIIKIIETKGDTSQQWNTSFDKLEGKGFFTKELEEALLAKTIDVAVHSHKDLPTENPEGLIIAEYFNKKLANNKELFVLLIFFFNEFCNRLKLEIISIFSPIAFSILERS